MLEIRICPAREGFKMPEKSTEGSAAYDVYLPEETIVYPFRRSYPLGFKIEVTPGYEAKIEPRSGFSSKGMEDITGARRDADVIQGKIDSDYRGEVGVIINNHEWRPFVLPAGTRIAQMTIYKVENAVFVKSQELSETERGEGGFGHSGTK